MTQISLRNWLAGQALAGLLAGSPTFLGKPDIPRALAVSAFQLADAMLAHAQPEPEPASVDAELLAAAKALVAHIECNTCDHTETHRGGAIWEICDDCGMQWADDMGGKPPFQWPAAVIQARVAIARAEGRAND